MSRQFKINPKLDFVIERLIDAPKRLVWEALTKPEHLKEWYTAIVTMESVGTGTRYAFAALHRDEADSEKNKASGWQQGPRSPSIGLWRT
jgi:uncharacterized protein YndB with AHSA1/START domain